MTFLFGYFEKYQRFQNAAEKRLTTVKTSRRPANIRKETILKSQVEAYSNPDEYPPKQAPTLPIAATDVAMAVTKSFPERVSKAAPKTIKTKYKKKKANTCATNSFLKATPSNFTEVTIDVRVLLLNSLLRFLIRIMKRLTLIPPDVEPAQPQIRQIKSAQNQKKDIHRLTSAVI